jgi:small redox-active disulfide protein 2
MEIKILGTGCSKCKSLETITRQAVSELNLDASIEKVEDIQKIMGYGIIRTPGLVVDGNIMLSGELPKVDELKQILSKNK